MKTNKQTKTTSLPDFQGLATLMSSSHVPSLLQPASLQLGPFQSLASFMSTTHMFPPSTPLLQWHSLAFDNGFCQWSLLHLILSSLKHRTWIIGHNNVFVLVNKNTWEQFNIYYISIHTHTLDYTCPCFMTILPLCCY